MSSSMSIREMKGRMRSSEEIGSSVPSGRGVGGRSRKTDGEKGSGSAKRPSPSAMAAVCGWTGDELCTSICGWGGWVSFLGSFGNLQTEDGANIHKSTKE